MQQSGYSPDGQKIEYGPDGVRLGSEHDPLLGAAAQRMGLHRGLANINTGISEGILKLCLIPWGVFLMCSLFVMLEGEATLAVVVMGAYATGFIFFAVLNFSQYHSDRALVYFMCGVAVVLGSFAGYFIFCFHSYDFEAFWNHRQYANVWPTEPAAAHRDASALVFSEGARPDVRLMGSYSGVYGTYCVAPIAMGGLIEPDHGDIQYWAVGIDCCRGGRFECGASSDLSARAGMVVYERQHLFSTWFPREADMYKQAARMVAAKFGAHSADRPIFVRWVKDLELAHAAYAQQAFSTWFKFAIASLPLWLLLSIGLQTVQQK